MIDRVTRHPALPHALSGAAGTALVAVGALGVGWLPLETNLLAVPLVEALRGSTAGSIIARGLVLIGLAILLQSWLVLGTALARSGSIGVRDLRIALAAWAAPLLLAPPMFSRDAYSYYVQGRLLLSGEDPTLTGVASISGWFTDGVDPMWAESPTPYGPTWLLAASWVAQFAHPNATLAAVLLRLVVVVGVVLIVWWLPLLAREHGIDATRALWLGALNPLVLMHFVSGAHNDALMTGLIVTGLALGSRGQCAWGVALIALAVTVKPAALVVLPFAGLLWAGRDAGWPRRLRAWALTLVVTACVVVSAMLVANAGAGLLQAAFGTPSAVLTWLSPATALGQSLGLAATALGLTPDPSGILTVVRALGAVAAVVLIVVLALRPEGRMPARSAGIALLAIVVLGPVVQPWYLLWSLPVLAATGLPARAVRAAVVLTALFTVHAMVETGATADSVLGLADAIGFALAAAIVALVALVSPRERRLVLAADLAIEPRTAEQEGRAALARWSGAGRIRA